MHVDQGMMTEEELERHRKPKRQVQPTDASSQVNCAKKTTGQAIPASLLQLVTFAESAACTSAVPSQSAPVPLKPSSFYPSTLHLDSPSTMDQLQIEQDDKILMEGIHDVWHGTNDTEKDDDSDAVSLYSSSEREDDDDDDLL